MESVLVGVDRSETCRRAVQFALSRAKINDWRVTIVHVINWSRFSFNTLEENEKRPVTRKKELKQAQKYVIDPLLEWAADEDCWTGYRWRPRSGSGTRPRCSARWPTRETTTPSWSRGSATPG